MSKSDHSYEDGSPQMLDPCLLRSKNNGSDEDGHFRGGSSMQLQRTTREHFTNACGSSRTRRDDFWSPMLIASVHEVHEIFGSFPQGGCSSHAQGVSTMPWNSSSNVCRLKLATDLDGLSLRLGWLLRPSRDGGKPESINMFPAQVAVGCEGGGDSLSCRPKDAEKDAL